jgi:hypothetical protein
MGFFYFISRFISPFHPETGEGVPVTPQIKALEIIMTIILVVCAAYIIWCLYKTSRYLREHPEDLRWPDTERSLDSRQKDSRNAINNQIK